MDLILQPERERGNERHGADNKRRARATSAEGGEPRRATRSVPETQSTNVFELVGSVRYFAAK